MSRFESVLDELDSVLSEAGTTFGAPAPWGGSDGGWRGMYGGLPGIPSPEASWPYRTNAAERVWTIARDMLAEYPELNERQVLEKALGKAGISPLELTPEDWRLLEMALEYAKNGTQYVTKPRIGGAPGGPFKNSEYGHEFVRTLGSR